MGLVQNIATSIKNAWDAVEEMGGEIPSNKNLANLPAGIASIPIGPSLRGLKKALDNGTAESDFPTGTTIDDTYSGVSNPLIVVKYGTVEKADGKAYNGVYLQRTYVTNVGQVWDPITNANYDTSAINTFLSTSYLSNCSETAQDAIAEIKVPVVTQSGTTTVNAKWFLPSIEEVYGNAAASNAPGAGKEGTYFPYWQNKTGWSSPSNNGNNGRIAYDANGAAQYWWLRTRGASNTGIAWYTVTTGMLTTDGVSATKAGVLPVCVVTGSEPLPTLTDLQTAIDDGTAKDKFPVGFEFEDTYNGQSNPLIVAQYLDSSNNSAYNGAEGVILTRKYAEDYGVKFNTANSNVNYVGSNILNYLNTTYVNNCSDELKALTSDLSVPYYNGSSMVQVSNKWHIPSAAEVYGNISGITGEQDEGVALQYWKDKTGLSMPSYEANAGRVVSSGDNQTRYWWLRTRGTTYYVSVVLTSGYVSAQANPTQAAYSILPMCFISKTTPPQPAL